MVNIQPINAFQDNYIWLITHKQTQTCAIVDPGDAEPVLSTLQHQQLTLSAILITHHHWDHTGGIEKIIEQYPVPVYGPYSENIPHITHRLKENDEFTLELLNLHFRVLECPGHTLEHIAYFNADEKILFIGDTLFAGGCGRLFEGTAEQMFQSLSLLQSLPDETKIYCAHEYTQANLRFAKTIEPDNMMISEQYERNKQLLKKYHSTIPTTLKLEKQVNPFLRCDRDSVKKNAEGHVKRKLDSPVEIFATIRQMKDHFRG